MPTPYATIQAAVAALPPSLADNQCISVSSGVYSEQVTIQGIATNDFRITISSAPGATVTVSPPASSTAAFHILNASVTLQGMTLSLNNSLPYVIRASSPNVVLNALVITAGNFLQLAPNVAVSISSESTISNSSVTAVTGMGFSVAGSLNTIFNSTVSVQYGSGPALSLVGASSNTITKSFFDNTAERSAYLDAGSRNNTISQSTFTGQGSAAALNIAGSSNAVVGSYIEGRGSQWGLNLNGDYSRVVQSIMVASSSLAVAVSVSGSSHTITQSYMINSAGDAATLDSTASYNTISQSTMSGSGAAYYGLYIDGARFNTITGSVLWNGVILDNGARGNTIALSRLSKNGSGGAALLVTSSSSNTVTQSFLVSSSGHGLKLDAAPYNTVDQSTVTGTAIGAGSEALLVFQSSFNTITRSYVSNPGGWAAKLSGSVSNTISQSTITSSSASYPALHLSSASFFNAITQSFIVNPAGNGAELDTDASHNTISQSTMTSSGAGKKALSLFGVSSNTVTQSHISNLFGYGVYLVDSGYNTISESRIENATSGVSGALYISATGPNKTVYNQISRSYVSNSVGHAGMISFGADHNDVVLSTFSSSGSVYRALEINNVSSITVTQSHMSNSAGGYGLLVSFSTGVTVSQSTMTSSGFGLHVDVSSAIKVTGSYAQGSPAAYIRSSTGTVLDGSVFAALGASTPGLWVANGNVGFTLSSSGVSGVPTGKAIWLDSSNGVSGGLLTFSSNTISGASVGFEIGGQGPGASLSVSSMTFSNLSAGATAINLTGGLIVSTFAGVNFADVSVGVNVMALALDAGSRVTMAGAFGPRAGPQFENDLGEKVDWPGFPAGPTTRIIGTSFAPPFLSSNEFDRPMLSLRLWNDSGAKTLTRLRVAMLGDLPAGLARARVWRDANLNGTLETGSDVYVGESWFVTGSPNEAVIVGLSESVTTSTITLFVALTYTNAPGGKTVELGVFGPSDLGLGPIVGPGLPVSTPKSVVRVSLPANPLNNYPNPTAGPPANGGFDTQLYVNKGQAFHIEAFGFWFDGSSNVPPAGSAVSGGLGAGLFIGQLVGRIGAGAWFPVNASSTQTASQSGNLFLAMSANSYSGVTGALDVTYNIIPSTTAKRWVGGAADFPTSANVDANWSPASKPAAQERVLFDASSADCDWDLPAVTFASLEMTTSYTGVLRLQSNNAIRNSLQVATNTVLSGGTLDVGWHELVVHGQLVLKGSATVDLGGGGGGLRVGTELVVSTGATLRSLGGGSVSIGQAFGTPNWVFRVDGGTLTAPSPGGLTIDARTVEFQGASKINAFNRVKLKGTQSWAPAAVFKMSVSEDWTFEGWTFDMASDVNADASAAPAGAWITFKDAGGPKAGSTREIDPQGRVQWQPDGGGAPGSIQGTVLYSGGQPGPYMVFASTSPDGTLTVIRATTTVAGAGATYTLANLPTPATYYVFAFPSSYGLPPTASSPRGGYGAPGSYRSLPIAVTPSGALTDRNVVVRDVFSLTGSWSGSYSQVGPVRFQGWRGGDPLVVSTATVEAAVIALSTSSTYSLFLQDATDYFIVGYVDVDNDAFPDSFEARGSSASVTISSAAHPGVSLFLSGGSAPAGGAVAVTTASANPGYAATSGWSSLLRVSLSPASAASSINALSVSFEGVVPSSGVSLGVFEDVNANGSLEPWNPDAQAASGFLSGSGGAFGVFGTTMTFFQTHSLPAGTTRHYFVAVYLYGQSVSPFTVFIGSSASFGLGAGSMQGQAGLYPISSGLVSSRLFVNAYVYASPDRSGGQYTSTPIYPGQTLVLSATGTWKRSASDPGVGPAGQPGTVGLNTVLQSANHGALIGRLQRFDGMAGDWFPLGETASILFQDGGWLYVAMNDFVGSYYDNAGAVAVDYSVAGSTVGAMAGVIYYKGTESGNISLQAISGPVTATLLIPIVGGTTYYPYVLSSLQSSGGYDVTAQVVANPIQKQTQHAALAAGTTVQLDFNLPISSGALSGVLSYSGVMPFGEFVIIVTTTTDFSGHIEIVGSSVMAAAGAYTIRGLAAPATYYVVAYRSAGAVGDEDEGPEHAEPFGYYGTPGAGVAQFGTALSPVFVPTGGAASAVNFSIFDTGEIFGRVALPPAPGGADVIVLAGKGVPGSAGFAYENEGRQRYQSATPGQVLYSVGLLRPATDYSVYAFLDLDFNNLAGAGEPTFFSRQGLAVPQGGSISLDFGLVAPSAPPAPTGFKAVPSETSVTFSWNTVESAAQYELRNSTSGLVVAVAHPTASFIDALAPNTSSHLRAVTATNLNGTSSSATLAVVYTLAAAPSGLAVTGVSQTTAQLAWTGANPAGTLFALERATQAVGPFGPVAQTISTTHVDGGLAGARLYFYRVRALNANGVPSAYSAPTSTTTDAASGPSVLGRVSYAGAQAGVLRVEASTSADFFPTSAFVTLPRSALQPYQLSVPPSAVYFVRGFIDVNGDGLRSAGEDWGPTSALSAAVAAAPVSGKDFSLAVDTVPPAAPAGLSSAPGFKQVKLAWNAPTKSADSGPLFDLLGFVVERSTLPGGPFVAIAPAISTAVFVDTAAAPGLIHYYRVFARDLGLNVSAPSGLISATPSPGGKVSGSLYSYAAAGPGVFHVRLSTLSFPGAPFVSDSTLPNFTFEGLADGVYYATGFLDRDNNGTLDALAEPAGTHGGITRPYPITIAGGNAVAGVDVVVCDRTPLGANQTKAGALSPGDCPARDKSSAHLTDLHSFVVGGGGAGSIGVGSQVNLKLTSTYDNELVLLGPDGGVMARDNRAGGAGLNLELSQPGVYVIEPTSFLSSTWGAYALSMSITGGFSGVVSGAISYSGTRPGEVYVQLFTSQDPGAFPVRFSTLPAPGGYSIGGLSDGIYYVRAFRDGNGNGARDAGEPSGVFGVVDSSPTAVHVTGGVASPSSVALTMTDPAAGRVAGALIYEGSQPGPLRVEIGPRGCADCGIGSVVAFASTSSGNSYALDFIAPATGYYLQAYVDSNGNRLADTLEAKASSSSVSIVAGATTTISLVVRDPGFGAAGNATIKGVVAYAGAQPGSIFLGFAQDSTFTSVDYVLVLSTQGPYVKTGVVGGTTYYVGAFRDVNGNSNIDEGLGEPSGEGEPVGWVGSGKPPIYVTLTGLTTANVTIVDPPSGEIRGRVSYFGSAPASQPLIVTAERRDGATGGGNGYSRSARIDRQAGVTSYDYVLPHLQASSQFSVHAWIDANGNLNLDPGEAVGYFIKSICSASAPCRSADVKVSSGAGTFPTYGVNVEARDIATQGYAPTFGGGEISGEVIYLGVQSGPLLVRMFDNAAYAGQPFLSQSIPVPAGPASVEFSFRNVPLGQYYLDAFRDTTGTGQFNPLFQGLTLMSASITASAPQVHVDGPALVDPGGAGSLNAFTGDFAAPGGARFDGGSSDLGFMAAIDTVTAGAPFVYVSGVTTQLDGLVSQIVKYSSTGAVLQSLMPPDQGDIPRLAFGGGYLYAGGSTIPFNDETDATLSVYDQSLNLVKRTRILGAQVLQTVAYHDGFVYGGAQDTELGSPDILRKIDPLTGVTVATGTFNFPGSISTPHGSAVAVDPNTGAVYAFMTTGGGDFGDLAGLLKFGSSLGAPTIVKDVTALQARDGLLAVSGPTGDVYLAFVDRAQGVARIKRYDSNLVELGSASTPILVSALVDRAEVTVDDDGTVYLGASSPNGGGDYLAVRYTADLTPLAVRTFDGFNGAGTDFGNSIRVHDSSNVFVVGAVNNGVNFDWATLRLNMNAGGAASAAGQSVVITTNSATQAIYGSLRYAGTLASSGTFRAALLRLGEQTPIRVATAAFSAAGGYLFNNVPAGRYLVRAMLDLNGNLSADVGEPIGFTASAGFAFGGAILAGLDVELCDRRQAVSGADVYDTLGPQDCRSSDIGSRQKLYTFQGRRGQSVTIGLDALGFVDSYLLLYGPQGGLVAKDDDSWGDGDALLQGLVLPEDGLYTIAAAAYDQNAVGGFRLLFNGSAGAPGAISGTVDYSGSQGGQIVVGLFRSTSFSTSTLAVSLPVPATRAFSFTSLPTGVTYYIGAFVDANLNKTADPGEDAGLFGQAGVPSPIALESGQNVQGVRVLIEASTNSAPSGFVTGTIAYSGSRLGAVRLEFWSSASFLGRPAAQRELPGGPGSYDVAVPGGVTYYVKGYLDADGDFTQDQDEPTGIYSPAGQGAQSVFVPVSNSVSGVDLSLRDPGTNALGGVSGEGSASISPSTATAGSHIFVATISYMASGLGIVAGGSVGFGVPPGWAYPQGVTAVSTSAASLSAVSYAGASAFVTVSGSPLLPGEVVKFVYSAFYTPCEVSTKTFQVASSHNGSAPRQPLVAGLPSVYTRPGAPFYFQPSEPYLTLEAGVRSESQTLAALDRCGNRSPVLSTEEVALRAKVFDGATFAADPGFGVSTGAAVSTTTSITLSFAAGESAKSFFALATSTGYKNLELFYDLGFEATSYVAVTVLPGGAISNASVSTMTAGVGSSSTTITPNNDGAADQAYIRFTLADPNLPWHVLLSSTPFKTGVSPIWETWGYGQPGVSAIAWDGRYSPWINGGGRVPNGLYFVRIEAAGRGVRDDSLSIGVSVAQLSGRVFDGGFTPNPPLPAARLALFGPNGFTGALTDDAGAFSALGTAAGAYNLSVSREDFLPGSFRLTATASGSVSTFTALTGGIAGSINASGGLDIVMSRAPALIVVPSLAVGVSTTANDRWGSLQVRSSTSAAVQLSFFSPLRLAAGTTTFDDGGQWDPGTQQFVRRTTMKFNVPQGAYVVEARLEGFAVSTAAVVVGSEGASVLLPAIAAKASISGTVTVASNPSGLDVSVDAVPLSTAAAVFGNSTRVRLAPGDVSEPYLIGGLDAGVFAVRAGAPGFATTSTAPITVASNGQTTGINPPMLTAGSSITGAVTIFGDTSSFPESEGGSNRAGGVYVNAWAPGTLSFGATFVHVLRGVDVVVPYAISGLNAGTTYLVYAGVSLTAGQWETTQPQPASVLGSAVHNVGFVASSGIISGMLLLPEGNTDFINVSVQGRVVAASRPEDVGSTFEGVGAHLFDNFRCVPANVPAPTGYCPAGSSTGTFKFFGQATQTTDLTVTYKTTGDTRKIRMSTVSGSTTTLFVDLTNQTWSVSGAINNQVSHPLFNTNPRVVANAQFTNLEGYPADISSSAARVVAVLQDPQRFAVAISTAFDPLTSRVGFLTNAGTFTIRNVPSGVYFVGTVGLAACTTCEVLVPAVGRVVRVSSNVAGVALTLTDGYSVSGSIALDGGLQDSDEFLLTLLNRRQEVVRSTTVVLGNAALGLTANSVAYSFVNIPSGDFYTLVVRAAGEAPRYVGRPIRFPDAGLSPNGLQSALAGQNVSLLRAAYATGRLRDAGTGALIGAANAGLLAPTFMISATANPWTEGGYAVALASTAGRPILADGTFRVGPLLPAVSYDVRFAQTSWDPAFLQRGSQNYTPAAVSGVTLRAGESRDLGVVSLNQGQSISGLVRSTATGEALGGIKVVGKPSFGTSGLSAQTYTDGQGRYSLWISTYLSSQYDVTAAPRDGNAASNGLVYGEVVARSISVSTRTTVDFLLTPLFGAVTGQIVVEDAATGGELSYPFGDLRGFPAAAINLQRVGVVARHNPLGDIEERTDAGGRFDIRGLSTGTYTMRVTSLGYSVFNATVTTTGSSFQLYTGSNTPGNYIPGGTITLRRGATVSGRIIKTDGSAPNASEVGGVAAANFAAGEFVVGSVDIDRVGKTVNSYSISGFKPGVIYDLVILPGGRGEDVSFPIEGRSISFTAAESTTTKNINLTFMPTGVDCRAASRALGNSQFQVKIDCTKALRNTYSSDSDLDQLFTVSTFTSAGAAPTSPNNTGQLLGSDKAMSSDRRQITAIYRAGAAETMFSLRLRASAAAIDPTTGANFSIDKVFDFHTGLESNVVERITNMNGGSVALEPSAQDEQLGLDERSRVDLKPGTFAYEDGVVVASATIPVGLTKARDRQSASVLYAQLLGYVPAALQSPMNPASVPGEVYAAMSAYRTQASTTQVGGANPLSSFYNIFLPAGVRHQLQQSADLTFSYATTNSAAAAANPDRINVWFYNAALGRFVLEAANRRVDAVNKTITVSVDHFSVFVVLDSTPVIQAPNVIQTAEILAVNFPNPADCITHSNIPRNSALFGSGGVVPSFQGTMIRYSLPAGAATEAKINIYNLAGEKIRTIEPGSLAGGMTYYSPWNCANESGGTVASGVYVGEVSWGGKKKFFKMAIIKGSGL